MCQPAKQRAQLPFRHLAEFDDIGFRQRGLAFGNQMIRPAQFGIGSTCLIEYADGP
jgi:hypothetical protein